MQDNQEPDATTLAVLKWPLIVAALLVGHIVLMLVALTAASAIPGAVEPAAESVFAEAHP